MSVKTRNDDTMRIVLEEASCHCTYRVKKGATKVVALCNDSDKPRATVYWRHRTDCTQIYWNLPIGSEHSRDVPFGATIEELRACILDGFVEMHSAWID